MKQLLSRATLLNMARDHLTVGPWPSNWPAHDVVLSAFNPDRDNPNIHADSLAGAKDIETAAKQSGVPHLVVTGGAGSPFLDGQ